MKRIIAPALAIAAALSFAACSKTLDSDDAEGKLADDIAPQIGVTADDLSVDCPDDIDAKEGTEATCSLTDDKNNKDYDIKLTMTDDDGNFTYEVVPKGS